MTQKRLQTFKQYSGLGENMPIVVRLPRSLVAMIDEAASDYGISRNQAIRKLLASDAETAYARILLYDVSTRCIKKRQRDKEVSG